MASIDEDPNKNDNIGCKAKIEKLVQDLLDVVGTSQDGDHETEVKHLLDGLDVGYTLVETCIKICSSLMSAIDGLAIAVNHVLDDVNKKLPNEEESEQSEGSSTLKRLTDTAEKFSELINNALSKAGATKKMASAFTSITGAISTDLSTADSLMEESIVEANQLAEKCTTYADKLRVEIRLAQETIQIASSVTSSSEDENTEADIDEACEEIKDTIEDADKAAKRLEQISGHMKNTLTEEKSPIFGTQMRKNTEDANESLEYADSMQRVLEKAVGKIKELVKGLEDIQTAQTTANVKSGLEEMYKVYEECETQVTYSQHIVDMIGQIAMSELKDADDDLKKIVKEAQKSADNTTTLIEPASKNMKDFQEKLQEVERALTKGSSDISETVLVELDNMSKACKQKCSDAKKSAKSAEIKMSKFIQADPHRQRGEDAVENAKAVIDDTLALAKKAIDTALEMLGTTEEAVDEDKKPDKAAEMPDKNSDDYWKTGDVMHVAERTLEAGKEARVAAERTSKLAITCQMAVADTSTFIDPNIISNLTRRTKECEALVINASRALEELEDTDPRNWPLLGLPPRVRSPLCILRAPGYIIDSFKNKITCSSLERSPVSPAAANQKQVSLIVTPSLLSVNTDEMPIPVFLAIRYDSKNDFGGDIMVKCSKNRKKWSIMSTISTERRFVDYPDLVFAEIKVKQFSSYAVLLRSLRSTVTLDDKGGEVVMPSKHPLSVSVQPGCFSGPTDVTLETTTPESSTRTLKYADPFIRTTFSPKPKKAVRLTLATRPPQDRSPVIPGQKNHLYCLYSADSRRWKVAADLKDDQERSPDGLFQIVLPPLSVNQQVLMALLWNSDDLPDLEEKLSQEQGRGMSKEARERHIFDACLSEAAFDKLSRHLTDVVEPLSVYLNVGDVSVRKIRSNYRDDRPAQAKQVLITWRQKTKGDNEKKVGLLRSSLHKCKRLDLAQKVQNDLREALNWGV
ncbi:uncharacterized protein LOC144347244 [Saccoglossus kowalevskii]